MFKQIELFVQDSVLPVIHDALVLWPHKSLCDHSAKEYSEHYTRALLSPQRHIMPPLWFLGKNLSVDHQLQGAVI